MGAICIYAQCSLLFYFCQQKNIILNLQTVIRIFRHENHSGMFFD